MLKRRKTQNNLILFSNMGGHLSFADDCSHKRKFTNNGIYFIDYLICLSACKDQITCRIFWNRKERIKKAKEINNTFIDQDSIRKELNGKR